MQDLRYAGRTLRRAPLFTVVAVLSMALGIGAATTAFSLVQGVILKPLAYREPGRLAYVQEVVPALTRVYGKMPVNLQHFFYWRDHSRTFQSLAALRASGPTLTGTGEPVQLDGVETTADLVRVLGVNMERGRAFCRAKICRKKQCGGDYRFAMETAVSWRQIDYRPRDCS